jgi:hypothetical protein
MEEKYTIALNVNGKDIPMNEFVQTVSKNVILGIVKSLTLKDVETVEEVEITLKAEE